MRFDELKLGTPIRIWGRGCLIGDDGKHMAFEFEGPFRGITDGAVRVGDHRARLRYIHGWDLVDQGATR